MSQITTLDPATDEPDDYEAASVECIRKVDLVRQKMIEDQREIDRLKTETQEILARLEAA